MKSPEAMGRMIKKYGPGYVALSIKSGRVVASGKDIKELWKKVKKKKIFRQNQTIIHHVPPPDAIVIY